MNYIETIYWLRLEFLYIFKSSANKILIINFSTPANINNFSVSKAFQTSAYVKGNTLENFI